MYDAHKIRNIRDTFGEKGLLNGFVIPEHPSKRRTNRLARRRLRHFDRMNTFRKDLDR